MVSQLAIAKRLVKRWAAASHRRQDANIHPEGLIATRSIRWITSPLCHQWWIHHSQSNEFLTASTERMNVGCFEAQL